MVPERLSLETPSPRARGRTQTRPSPGAITSPRSTAVLRTQSIDFDAEDIDALSSNLFQVNPYTGTATKAISAAPPSPDGDILSGTASGSTRAGRKSFEAKSEIPKADEILMLELTAEGGQEFKTMRLRELLEYVNEHARAIDASGGGYGVGKQKDKTMARAESSVSLTHSTSGSMDGDAAASTASSNNNGGGGGGGGGGNGLEPLPYCSAVNPLRLRDLRRLESRYDGAESTLLVRWHAVLLSLDPIMAIIMTNRIILLVPDGADSLLAIVEEHVMTWVDDKQERDMGMDMEHESSPSPGGSPREGEEGPPPPPPPAPAPAPSLHQESAPSFEAHAYDALFTTVSSLLAREFTRFEREVDDVRILLCILLPFFSCL
jgi:hypothetical protein